MNTGVGTRKASPSIAMGGGDIDEARVEGGSADISHSDKS